MTVVPPVLGLGVYLVKVAEATSLSRYFSLTAMALTVVVSVIVNTPS